MGVAGSVLVKFIESPIDREPWDVAAGWQDVAASVISVQLVISLAVDDLNPVVKPSTVHFPTFR